MKYWILLLILPALSAPAAAQAYKCKNADGRTEITSTPCSGGANTVKTVREEPVSEASRQRAEQEAARRREALDKLEANQRQEEAAERERERQASQRQPVVSPENNGRSVDDCLRDLDRQALQPAQRSQMEAACRGSRVTPQPTYVPVPVAVPVAVPQQRGNGMPPGRPAHEPEQRPAPGLAHPAPGLAHPAPGLASPPPGLAKPQGTPPPLPCPPGSKHCSGK